MGAVKEFLFEPEDRESAASRAAAVAEHHKEEARKSEEKLRRERRWAAEHPDEWGAWVNLRLVLDIPIVFGPDKGYDYPEFLDEVGKRPSPEHVIRRKNTTSAYQRGNLHWVRRKTKSGRTTDADTLKAKQAAEFLGVGKSTVYDMFKKGELPGYKVRGRVVFDAKGLSRFRQNRANRPVKGSPPMRPAAEFPPKKPAKSQPPAPAGLLLRPPASLLNSARRSSP